MPGYSEQSESKGLPPGTYLKDPAGTSAIFALHTTLFPINSQGMWGHKIPTKGGNHIWAACANRSEGCPWCLANDEAKAKNPKITKDELPYGYSQRGFAIASRVATIETVTSAGVTSIVTKWLPEPVTGIFARGPEGWKALDDAEGIAAMVDSTKPDKIVLPRDWTQWYMKIRFTTGGIQTEAMAVPVDHPLPILSQETMEKWRELLNRAMMSWPDAAEKVKQHKFYAQQAREKAQAPTSPAQAQPFVSVSPNQAEFNRIAGLGIKAKMSDGSTSVPSVATWNERVVAKHGKPFSELPEEKQLNIIAGLKLKAEEQGLNTDKPKSNPVDDIVAMFD